MEYQIQRGDQKFGPYSLAELQQYVQEGRVLLTDLAQSEGMSDWVSVSQILGNIPIPAPAQVLATAPQDLVPLPPNMPWVVVLLILIVGQFLGLLSVLFITVWSIVLANWARRLVNNNSALVLVGMYPAGFIAGILAIGSCGLRDRVLMSRHLIPRFAERGEIFLPVLPTAKILVEKAPQGLQLGLTIKTQHSFSPSYGFCPHYKADSQQFIE